MIFLKLKYRARRWKTAWCFQIFLMGTESVSLYLRSHSTFNFFRVAQKTMLYQQKNTLKEIMLRSKIM